MITKVWICGKTLKGENAWEFQGVFSSEELGLIERINREILHPLLGLAMSRTLETGHSEKVLISDDGEWKYGPGHSRACLSDDEIKLRLYPQEKADS